MTVKRIRALSSDSEFQSNMPTYLYRCSDCGHSFDFFQKFADDPLTECPECGGPIRRVPQPVGIVFKGSGWYVNDSRDAKKSTSKTSSDSPDKSAGDAKTKASDGKSATTESSEKKSAVATKES
jgi:putative FmdB family regulatory protein